MEALLHFYLSEPISPKNLCFHCFGDIEHTDLG